MVGNIYNYIVSFIGVVPIEFSFIYSICTIIVCALVFSLLFAIILLPFILIGGR